MLLIVQVRDRRPDVEQVHVLRLQLLRPLLQRRDVVRYPDAPAVRGDNQVVVTRVNEDVVGAHRRIVAHEFLPLPAAVERDEQPELGPGIQQVPVLRILANHLDVPVRRQIAGDRVERLAEVVRDEHVWFQVVVPVPVHRHVRRARVEM